MRALPIILISAPVLIAIWTQHEALIDLVMPAERAARTTLAPITEIREYIDQDFQFSMAVPADWNQIIADEPVSEFDQLETIYAVGFESVQSGAGDTFADYIMVEITPGLETGAFETDGSLRRTIQIDGHPAIEDELQLENYRIEGRHIDLQVYQAELYQLGYTVGFYAIGEHREASRLRDAFRLMIETFKLPPHVFDVS